MYLNFAFKTFKHLWSISNFEIFPSFTFAAIAFIASSILSGKSKISQPASNAFTTTSILPYLSETPFIFKASLITNPLKSKVS